MGTDLPRCGEGEADFKAEQETPRNPSVRLAAQLDSESRGSSQVVIPYFNG